MFPLEQKDSERKPRQYWSTLAKCPSEHGLSKTNSSFPDAKFQFSGNLTNKTLNFTYREKKKCVLISLCNPCDLYLTSFTLPAAILSGVPWELAYDLIYIKGKKQKGAEKEAERLRAALAGKLGLGPSTHRMAHTSSNLSSRGSDTHFGPPQAAGTHAYRQMLK